MVKKGQNSVYVVIEWPLNLGSVVTYLPPDTHGCPGGGGVLFSKDPGQLESRSVSVLSHKCNVKKSRPMKLKCQNWRLQNKSNLSNIKEIDTT